MTAGYWNLTLQSERLLSTLKTKRLPLVFRNSLKRQRHSSISKMSKLTQAISPYEHEPRTILLIAHSTHLVQHNASC
eukprot:1058025-Amphidinium_carterae.1